MSSGAHLELCTLTHPVVPPEKVDRNGRANVPREGGGSYEKVVPVNSGVVTPFMAVNDRGTPL